MQLPKYFHLESSCLLKARLYNQLCNNSTRQNTQAFLTSSRNFSIISSDTMLFVT